MGLSVRQTHCGWRVNETPTKKHSHRRSNKCWWSWAGSEGSQCLRGRRHECVYRRTRPSFPPKGCLSANVLVCVGRSVFVCVCVCVWIGGVFPQSVSFHTARFLMIFPFKDFTNLPRQTHCSRCFVGLFFPFYRNSQLVKISRLCSKLALFSIWLPYEIYIQHRYYR